MYIYMYMYVCMYMYMYMYMYMCILSYNPLYMRKGLGRFFENCEKPAATRE